jgi:putative oxidoreductase
MVTGLLSICRGEGFVGGRVSVGNKKSARSVFQVLKAKSRERLMKTLINWLIGWPERVARPIDWLAPLFARIVVGWVFLWSGWGKLQNLPAITDNFASWGIPLPHVLAPFVSGVEFFGGIFLLLGLMTRISAGALGVTMIVAIKSAKWDQVDSLETLLGFDETEYLALFLWLAIAGAGSFSLDRLLRRSAPR